MKTKQLLLFFVAFIFNAGTQAQVITTYAGGKTDFTGYPPLSFGIDGYFGQITKDAAGNIYFGTLNQIYRVNNAIGNLQLIAGNGNPSNYYSNNGNGGLAINATLSNPHGLTFDSIGNLYFIDQSSQSIRRVDASGIITLVYSNTNSSIHNIGIVKSNFIYCSSYATYIPTGLNIEVIRKINISTGVSTIIAGDSTKNYGFSGDGGLATAAQIRIRDGRIIMDNFNNIYFADEFNNRIRKIDTAGIITTVFGTNAQGYNGDGGLPTWTQLYRPQGIAIDGMGNLYVADTYNNRIRKLTTTGVVSTIAGTGTGGFSGDGGLATIAKIYMPTDITVDALGNVYFYDGGDDYFGRNYYNYTRRIRKINTAGMISSIAGNGTNITGDGELAKNTRISLSNKLSLDTASSIYFADNSHNRIKKISKTGIITTVAGNGGDCINNYTINNGDTATKVAIPYVHGIVPDKMGNLYFSAIPSSYSVGNGTHRIMKLSKTGILTNIAGTTDGFSGDGGLATSAKIQSPRGLALDNIGNIYIADYRNNRIRKVNTSGIISTIAGTGTAGFSGDGGLAINAMLNRPYRIASDGLGNLYISDDNYRIRKINISGIINTIAGNGTNGNSGDGGLATNAQIGIISDITLDQIGNLFIVDRGSNSIRKVDINGIITTIAGNGVGFSGDGDNALYAQFNNPNGVAVDATGTLYIADNGNMRVRKISYEKGFINPAVTPSTCGSNGSIILNPTGGKSPYKFNINGSLYQASNSFNNLAPALYIISVKDSNNIVFTDTVSTIPAGALNFDGATTYITVPNNSHYLEPAQLTCEAWIKRGRAHSVFPQDRIMISRDANGWGFLIDDDQLGLTSVGLSQVYATTRINDTMWHHVAFTYDGTTASFYIDGNSAGVLPYTAPPFSTTSEYSIGHHVGGLGGADQYFLGNIDELRVWNRVLTPAEIVANINKTLMLPQTGLLAYYRFDQGTIGGKNQFANILYDSSFYGNYGQLFNFKLKGNTSNWVAGQLDATCKASISGRLVTANNKAIRNATVTLKGNATNAVLTNIKGEYLFDELKSGSYSIKSSRILNVAKNNGVSSIDIVLAQRHILNITKLNSPYKIIAADVNNDKKISAIDVIFMKRLILGIDTSFTGNRLWAFVDSAYKFPDTTNPFPYKDSISFTNLTSNKTNQTFIGVKLGDVNYDWNPSLARGTSIDNVQLIIDNGQLIIDNGQLKIPFKVKNFKDLTALQYTLHFDNSKYEFVGIENNKLGIEFNEQQATRNGSISFLWADTKGEEKTLEDGSEVFTLLLRGKRLKPSSEWDINNLQLTINNSITEIEAWDKDNQQHNIILTKQTTQQEPQTLNTKQWLSVFPNPAKGEINITVKLNNNSHTNLIVYNALGQRVLTTQQYLFENVIKEVKLNIQSLYTGNYYVQIVDDKNKILANTKFIKMK